MKDIMTAPFMIDMVRTITEMYRHGWDERNGGNVSLMLTEDEVNDYIDTTVVYHSVPTGFDAPALLLAGKYFLVTGAGKYFKNVRYAPAENLGIVRISEDGRRAEYIWGFTSGGAITTEFAAHMMTHLKRLKVDPRNRVVIHCHPANLIAMTYVHDLDEVKFTRTLWKMCTEAILAFPDGVNVLPWMMFGTNEIGVETAKKMLTSRLVVWAQHGIYSSGRTLDETFGLIETAEKAAEIYLKVSLHPIVNTISDEQLHQIEREYGVKARDGYLN